MMVNVPVFFFFFSSRRRHTRSLCDWSSDVCSSDLVEVADRDDVVPVEIELEAETALVPLHRALQAVHRPARLVELSRLDIQEQLLPLLALRDEFIFQQVEVCRDHREEIGRLRKRIVEA